jgi:phosphoserine phosphatase
MEYILTLVAALPEYPLTSQHLELIRRLLPVEILAVDSLAPSKALACRLAAKPTREARRVLEEALMPEQMDCFIVADDGCRRKQLLVADMDNTMVIGETLDDLADQCGLKARVAPITDRAMKGEINFQEALCERVAMLAGLSEKALAATLNGIRFTPGAVELVTTMSAHGAECVLVSGGFTYFTGSVARQLGFHQSYGNVLEIVDGRLTGQVVEPIIDYLAKKTFLQTHLARHGYAPEQALAIGDGANDLAMLQSAGLGIGFHPKPYLRANVENSVVYGDLTCLLYVQGYRAEEIRR